DNASAAVNRMNPSRLLFQEALHVEGVVPVVGELRSRDFHHMTSVVDRSLAERSHAVAARVVLFFHHHVDGAVFGKQANWLAVAEALLCAITMLFTVLAYLEIAGEIHNFACYGRDLGRHVRLAVHGCAHRGCTPGLGGGITEFAH